MQDDVKKALEELEQTFAIVHRVATHQSDAAYMSIPADPKRDADLRHMVAVESLRAHIDAEPARLAAAREEQREADARGCEDGEVCRCDSIDSDAQCGHCLGEAFAATVRATPLTATPLADRIAELEVQRDVRQRYGDRMKDERDAALARVKELKTALHLEREAHERALREVLDPVVRAKMMEPPPPLLLAPDVAALVAERDDLKAQLAEAMGVLRYLVEFIAAGGTPDDEDLAKARAFLAKYPEGR